MKQVPLFVLISTGLSSACITVRTTSVDRKTALEQQFIGEYEDLSDDLATDASARAEASGTGGMGERGNDPYARALQARRLQKFYRDDLDQARARGCIGEGNDGKVVELTCAPSSQPATAQANEPAPSTSRLVKTENAARDALVEYAIGRDPNLNDGDRPMVWQALRRLMLSVAPKGTPIQNGAGQWVRE